MQIIEFGADDPDRIAEAHRLLLTAHRSDTPENPAPARRFFENTITHPWPGRRRHWFTAEADSQTVGYLRVSLWTDSNPHLAHLDLVVHPDHRRRGIGAALLDTATATARASGRDTLVTSAPIAWDGGPRRGEEGARFLENHGFERALTSVNRRCPVDALETAEEDRLLHQALAAAGDDYELRQWIGRVPDDLLVTMCRMDSMIVNEIPLGDLEVEAEQVDTEKARQMEAAREAEGRIAVDSVAVDRTTGEVVAWSDITVDDGPYPDAHQGITIVDPSHRGHRLGLLVKLANLRHLREHFGGVEAIWTDNADVNSHMIAINERLGYETVDAAAEYQRKLES